MNPSPSPIAPTTRTLKTIALATRLLLWCVLAAWVLFALAWGALHLWILPRIDQWRPDLERWATRAVGVPVRVAALHADADGEGQRWLPAFVPGLAPRVTLQGVSLLDPQGREALHLPQVQAILSPRSLWRGGFEQIIMQAPVLDVRRTAQGRLEVAGLDFSDPAGGDHAAADWLFSQPVFVIQQGTVRWTDEQRAQPPLALSALDLVLRNTGRRHAFRLDATPPAEWGQRLSLRGQLSAPLLALSRPPAAAPWHNWGGELYAELPHADVARLRAHVPRLPWGLKVDGGRGALRVWGDVNGGRLVGLTADLDLQALNARLGADLPALAIDTLRGRLSADWNPAGWGLSADQLSLRTGDGLLWPAGALSLRHRRAQAGQTASTTLSAEAIDLATLAALARHLPLPGAAHGWLQRLQPAGQVRELRARWQGDAPGDGPYQAQGRVEGLALTGEDSGQTSAYGPYPVPGRPGIRGASVGFAVNQDGGRAQVQISDGALELPGVFEERWLPLQRLQTEAVWTVQGERIDVRLKEFSLANADAQGSGQARWHTADPATSPARARFPGVLELDATLSRADASRVHRYLPLSVAEPARRYVREAVRAGRAERLVFSLRGDIWDMPFNAPGAQGLFRISADLRAVDFDYVPAYLQTEGDVPWPALRGVNGRLLLQGASLQLSGLQAGLADAPGVRLGSATATIADLAHDATLLVTAQAQGPADELLGFVRRSPLNTMTGQALAQAQAGGTAQLGLQLSLPIHALRDTRVQGTVQFPGNDLRISPEAPLLGRASGTLAFSERGFTVSNGQARLYGGELRFDGGMAPDANGLPRILLRGQGSASAEGLRAADLGFVSRLFANASGSAAYSVQLGFRGDQPELSIRSDLQGMAFALPAPLGKAASERLPLQLDTRVLSTTSGLGNELPLTDRLQVTVGAPQQPLLGLLYERDISGPEPQVLRGSLALGTPDAAPLPERGVAAHIHTPLLDADAWEKALADTTGVDIRNPAQPATRASLSYLPDRLALRTDRLVLGGRSFNRLVLGATRQDGGPWLANVQAQELDGHVAYRPPAGSGAGSVQARLTRLLLPAGAAQDVEQILQQPSSVPALDIVVDDLTVAGRRLGRIEIEAINRGELPRTREWRLTRLRLDAPEARLSASGNWVATSPGAPRRTALSFGLDISDGGQLLARLGRDGLVRGGQGRIEGNIGWLGSPLVLDHASLSGQIKADIQRGQFLKVEPGAAKLLGVLSLQALPRRLMLDFRDVFSEGFAFDFVRGDARIERGVLTTNNLQMTGVNAAVLMEGSADLARETQDLQVLVVPEINTGTASLLATAVNPAIGLGTFLAQLLLRSPLQNAVTQQFRITGSWADPQVNKVDAKAQAAPRR